MLMALRKGFRCERRRADDSVRTRLRPGPPSLPPVVTTIAPLVPHWSRFESSIIHLAFNIHFPTLFHLSLMADPALGDTVPGLGGIELRQRQGWLGQVTR